MKNEKTIIMNGAILYKDKDGAEFFDNMKETTLYFKDVELTRYNINRLFDLAKRDILTNSNISSKIFTYEISEKGNAKSPVVAFNAIEFEGYPYILKGDEVRFENAVDKWIRALYNISDDYNYVIDYFNENDKYCYEEVFNSACRIIGRSFETDIMDEIIDVFLLNKNN